MLQTSALVTLGFIALPLLLAAAFVLGTAWAGRRTGQGASSQYWWALGTALGALGWLTLTWALAASGTLRRFDMAPPPLVVLLLSVVALGVAHQPDLVLLRFVQQGQLVDHQGAVAAVRADDDDAAGAGGEVRALQGDGAHALRTGEDGAVPAVLPEGQGEQDDGQ